MPATIPLDLIEDGDRLRGINEVQVGALVNSIGDVGLLNPVTVYKRAVIRGGGSVEGYGLIAGLHRKAACERLGLVEIDAHIVELGELERQIAECDENLCASQLSASERARFTKRRKEAYEALHPETEHGVNQHSSSRQVGDSTAERFTADTAKATSTSERSVQRDAERGEKVIPEVLSLIGGTKLDTGTYLDKLKKLPPNEQVAAAKRDLAFEKQKARAKLTSSMKVADIPLDDEAAKERQVAALMSAWNRAGIEARQEFLERIEQPAFDGGRDA